MTRAHPRTPSRLRVFLTLARALAVVVIAVVLYYLLPLTAEVDVGTLLRLVVGLVVLAAAIAWQIRSIVRSRYPTLRAVEALAVTIPVFLLLFAATYALMSRAQPASFTEPMDRSDALYFTVTVFATVGFGDISAVSTSARVGVPPQMIAALLPFGLVLRAVLDAVRRGHGRQDAEQSD